MNPAESSESPALMLPNSSASVPHAVGLLEAGKLVVVPTETVYGIAVNLRSAAGRQRVKAIKQIRENPNWVIHVGSAEQALNWFLKGISPLGRRVLRRAWPGPVALQFKLSELDLETFKTELGDAAAETLVAEKPGGLAEYATFRCPDVAVTQDVLSGCFDKHLPIAIIGAHAAGGGSAYEVAALAPQLADGVDAIIDAGPTRYRKPSTLVRVSRERIEVLRPGIIDERIIQRLADLLIVFLCSGNTCRSPMAAALATKLLAERLGTTPEGLAAKHVVVQSAGVHAMRGMRATREAIDVMNAMGADLGGHLSQPAAADLLRRADVIYTMTQAHREEALSLLPGGEKKIVRLDPDGDIDDPIGSNEAVYQKVADRLLNLLQQRLSEIPL